PESHRKAAYLRQLSGRGKLNLPVFGPLISFAPHPVYVADVLGNALLEVDAVQGRILKSQVKLERSVQPGGIVGDDHHLRPVHILTRAEAQNGKGRRQY